jgi:hypothetical protein
MGYKLPDSEYAALFNVTARTIRNWKRKGAPLDSSDPSAMALFQSRERSRRGVSKNSRRTTSIKPVMVAKEEKEDNEWGFEDSIKDLVDPILALRERIKANHPKIAEELLRIAHIADYVLTIEE